MLTIHKFELNCIFRIQSDSSSAEFITPYLANSAEDESDLIRNIQFNSNLCIVNMHSLRNYIHFIYTRDF